MTGPLGQAEPILLGGLALLGLVIAFLGYRILHGTVRVYGTLAGMILAALAAPPVALHFGLPDNLWLVIPFLLVGGVAGYFLSRPLYFLMVFATGAAIAPTLWAQATLVIPNPPAWAHWAVPILSGLVLGFIAIRFERPLIILGTALTGAFLATAGSLELAGFLGPEDSLQPWHSAVLLALTAFGVFVQFRQKTSTLPAQEEHPPQST